MTFMRKSFLISVLLTLSFCFLPGIVGAATDATLVKPVLQRYDQGGKSYTAPFDKVVVLNKGEKITLAGASQPGGRVTLIVGTKSIATDGVSNGTWAADINADELPAGADTIVGQTVVGSRTSELANLLKIEVATKEAAGNDSSQSSIIVYVVAGVIVLAAIGCGFWLFGRKKKGSLGKNKKSINRK